MEFYCIKPKFLLIVILWYDTFFFYISIYSYLSKIQICSLLLAGTVGSHLTGEMDVCPLRVLIVVR